MFELMISVDENKVRNNSSPSQMLEKGHRIVGSEFNLPQRHRPLRDDCGAPLGAIGISCVQRALSVLPQGTTKDLACSRVQRSDFDNCIWLHHASQTEKQCATLAGHKRTRRITVEILNKRAKCMGFCQSAERLDRDRTEA